MASVPIIFFYLLNTAGLDAVLVQKRDLSEPLRAQVFGIVILTNLLLFLAFLGVAPWIAAFYDEPRLTAIVRVLGFQFVLLAFETLPQSQLERDIDFGRRSIVELVTIVAGSLTAWTLARAGFGVWTLVWGSLTTTAIRMVGLNLAQRSLCWPRFSLEGMKRRSALRALGHGGSCVAVHLGRFRSIHRGQALRKYLARILFRGK
jgi:O-antigen/teichoic acid export membrane protein